MPTATLIANEPAGTALRLLTFDHVPAGYQHPGQFLTATVGERKPAFFAIASCPGQQVQLLVKQLGDTAEVLCALSVGDTAELSDVMGKGFQLQQVDGLELVILVNGSGISAARSVIQAEIDKGLPRPVSFLYGVLTPGHRSFLADLEAWARAGIQVHTVIGEPTGTGWHGATGFVQDHAAAVGLVRANVGVVLVGLPVMVEQAKATYAAADAPNTHLLVNF